MNFDEEPGEENIEQGSDELLADDELRLPEGASFLVRLHAVRAWLARRQEEARAAIGEAALDLQALMQAQDAGPRLRRREREAQALKQRRAQDALAAAQQQLTAYEEAGTLLEEYVAHIGGERILVEYYLALTERFQEATAQEPGESPRLQALGNVLNRVERVCIPPAED